MTTARCVLLLLAALLLGTGCSDHSSPSPTNVVVEATQDDDATKQCAAYAETYASCLRSLSLPAAIVEGRVSATREALHAAASRPEASSLMAKQCADNRARLARECH